MLTKTLVETLATDCQPTWDPVLDDLFVKYNGGSPRQDDPVYYRFLYALTKHFGAQDIPLTFIEVGCYSGAASLHFLSGYDDPRAIAYGIDTTDGVKPVVRAANFRFTLGSSINPGIVQKFEDGLADVILIDTDHTYKTTAAEFRLWLPKLKPGGIMLFDDIDAPEYAAGCGKFFRELSEEKVLLPQLHPDNWGFGVWFNC